MFIKRGWISEAVHFDKIGSTEWKGGLDFYLSKESEEKIWIWGQEDFKNFNYNRYNFGLNISQNKRRIQK